MGYTLLALRERVRRSAGHDG